MIALLGYLGAALLCLCGLPLLFSTRWGDKLFLWLWFLGECAMLVYVGQTDGAGPYLLNYGFNVALVGFVLWKRRNA